MNAIVNVQNNSFPANCRHELKVDANSGSWMLNLASVSLLGCVPVLTASLFIGDRSFSFDSYTVYIICLLVD